MIRTIRRAIFAMLIPALCAHTAWAQTTPEAPEPDPKSELSAELFYQLLLGELNAIGGEPGVGFSLMLDAARKTDDPRLYQRATDIALRGRSGESALQAARAWRTAQPQSREANRYLLQILIGLNRLAESVDPIKRELSFASGEHRVTAINNVPAFFARTSDKKLSAGTVEQALSEYLTSAALGPAAWTAIGRMRLEAKDPAGALDAAQRGQALDPGADGPAIVALSLFGADMPQAEAIIKRYLERDPRFEVRMDYARVLIGKQRYAESALQLDAVTRDMPDYAQAWLVKGTLEQQNRNLDAAQISLKRFIELQGANTQEAASAERTQALTQAYLRLAEIAEQRKDLDGAQAWLAQIDNPAEIASVQTRRAAILARQGKLDEARALIHSLPGEDPADARFKISAEVQILRDNKKYQLAHDVLAQALQANPNDVDFLYDRAMMAEKLGDVQEMEQLLRKAIAAKPDYHHAYNALGYSLADRNLRLPEARYLILKALEYAPDDPFISDSLAWVEFRSGNHPEALRILEKAFKDRPDAEIAAHLGEVLWVMGQREQATSIWREGMGLNSENETLLQTLKRLRVDL